MSQKYYFVVVSLALAMLLALPGAFAQEGAPCVPNRFYGTATVNGNSAPTGLEITARINGLEMASTITVDGKFGYIPYVFDVPDNDNNCENSATVYFFIEGQAAGQATYSNGNFTRLELSATGVVYCGDASCNNGETCSTCPEDCGTCSTGTTSTGGGGGGGGSSGGTYTAPPCTPDWECSPWSQCINDTQTRTCTDVDNCDTEEGMPALQQACGIGSVLQPECTEGTRNCVGQDVFECTATGTWEEVQACASGCSEGACVEEIQNTAGSDSITGMFLNSTTTIYALIALVVILLGALVWKMKK